MMVVRRSRAEREAREDAVYNTFVARCNEAQSDSADVCVGTSKAALYRAWMRLFPSAGRAGVAGVRDVLEILDSRLSTHQDAEALLFRVTGFEGGPLSFAQFGEIIRQNLHKKKSANGDDGATLAAPLMLRLRASLLARAQRRAERRGARRDARARASASNPATAGGLGSTVSSAADVRHLFCSVDKDGDGTLSIPEFRSVLRRLDVVDDGDAGGRGGGSWDVEEQAREDARSRREFCGEVPPARRTRGYPGYECPLGRFDGGSAVDEHDLDGFDAVNRDADGLAQGVYQLRAKRRRRQKLLARNELDTLVRAMDQDGDGNIDYREFAAFLYSDRALERAVDADLRNEDTRARTRKAKGDGDQAGLEKVARAEARLLREAHERAVSVGRAGLVHLRHAFAFFDRRCADSVSAADLRETSGELGHPLTEAQAHALLRRVACAKGGGAGGAGGPGFAAASRDGVGFRQFVRWCAPLGGALAARGDRVRCALRAVATTGGGGQDFTRPARRAGRRPGRRGREAYPHYRYEDHGGRRVPRRDVRHSIAGLLTGGLGGRDGGAGDGARGLDILTDHFEVFDSR